MDRNSSESLVSEEELSALADGTLTDPDRRAELERVIEASPELSAAYERERRVVLALSEARQERAPHALRMRLEAQRPTTAARLGRRLRYGMALAGAVAAVLLVIALALPGGPGGPSVSEAAGLALRGPAAAGPAVDPAVPARLELNAGALYFPNWGSYGWTAVGQRTDTFHGRSAVTVYYRWHRRVLAYTIVELPALREPAAPATRMNGVDLRTLRLSGRIVVTWRQDGQTCILAASGLSQRDLDRLASSDSTRLHAEHVDETYA